MQAALALSQWGKLDERIARAKEIDQIYRDGLRDVNEIIFTDRPQHGHLMWPDFKTQRRDELVEDLSGRGITLRAFWPTLHSQPAYKADDRFPGAEDTSRHACWLPCAPNITNDQLARVVEAIRSFFS